jgi:hypothetical protein
VARKTDKKAPRRHHKAEKLSPEARLIIDHGLAANDTYVQIVRDVAQATGETISVSAVGRYHAGCWRPSQESIRRSQEIAESLMRSMLGVSTEELERRSPEDVERQLGLAIRTRTAHVLMPVLPALAEQDPGQVTALFANLERSRVEELRVRQRYAEIELKAEALEHEKRLVEAKLAEIARKAEAVTKKGGKAPSREDLEQLVRDVYGLARPEGSGEALTRSAAGGATGDPRGTGSAGAETSGAIMVGTEMSVPSAALVAAGRAEDGRVTGPLGSGEGKSCPACRHGRLKLTPTADGSGWESERCGSCGATWWNDPPVLRSGGG